MITSYGKKVYARAKQTLGVKDDKLKVKEKDNLRMWFLKDDKLEDIRKVEINVQVIPLTEEEKEIQKTNDIFAVFANGPKWDCYFSVSHNIEDTSKIASFNFVIWDNQLQVSTNKIKQSQGDYYLYLAKYEKRRKWHICGIEKL